MYKKQSTLSKPVLIFAIVGLILAAGLGAYTVYSKNADKISPTNSPTPSATIASPSKSSAVSPALTPSQSQPSVKSLTVSELWTKRNEYLNQKVTVEDIVTLLSSCPNYEGVQPSECSTAVYLGLQGANNFRLYKNGQTIDCSGMPSSCQGFEKDKKYKITGTLLKKDLGSFYLDVLSSQML